MKRTGLDSAESWAIVAASIVINFLILAPARLSGVLFVAFMSRYDVNRKQASLPFTVCYILRTLPGPLAGYLGVKFGLRRMSILGCLLATVGVGACFLANDIVAIVVFLGGFYGLGYGFVCALIPEFLNQYFNKHLAKANGLTMGAAGLGSFLFPPIVEFFSAFYGVSGMLLLFGALVLHSIPAAMLLRKAKFSKTSSMSKKGDVSNLQEEFLLPTEENHRNQIQVYTITSSSEEVHKTQQSKINGSFKNDSGKHKALVDTDATCLAKDNLGFENVEPLPYPLAPSEISKTNFGNHNNLCLVCTADDRNCTLKHENKSICESISNSQNHNTCIDNEQRDYLNLHQKCFKISDSPLLLSFREKRSSFSDADHNFDFKKNTSSAELKTKLADSTTSILSDSGERHSIRQSFRVFIDPAFILIALTQSSYFFIMFLIWTIIIDFVRDKGIPQNEEVYFAMCYSLSDTIGRLGLGWITDCQFLSKANYSALSFVFMGLTCLVLPWTRGFAWTISVVFLYGFISGGIMINFPGMVNQFISKDLRTMAMASRTVLNAPMSLALSPMIGYFRGHLGSYDWIFYIVTMICITCAITTWLTPTVATYRDRKKKIHQEAKR